MDAVVIRNRLKKLLPDYEIGVRFTTSERFSVRATKEDKTVKLFVDIDSVNQDLKRLARDILDQME